jgi:hypothetical protein
MMIFPFAFFSAITGLPFDLMGLFDGAFERGLKRKNPLTGCQGPAAKLNFLFLTGHVVKANLGCTFLEQDKKILLDGCFFLLYFKSFFSGTWK